MYILHYKQQKKELKYKKQGKMKLVALWDMLK